MGRRILLVEGKNDAHVMYALCQHHRLPEKFKVEAAGSVEDLLDLIRVRPKESDLDRLAVILDADDDLPARWAQVRARAAHAGYSDIPDQPIERGTLLVARDLPRLGVWLMPNNQLPGMLEDFLTFLVPSTDPSLPLVDQFLNGIPTPARRFRPAHRPKARIHAWLAVQEEPGKPLGQAITARYLDAESAVIEPFLVWLRAALVD
jgi:hypothetical protein